MIYIQPGDVYDKDKPRVLFDNLFTRSNAVVSGDEDPLFPVSNMLTGATWDFWKPPSSALSNAVATFPAGRFANCAFIGAHNLGSTGASFRIQYSTDGGASWSALIPLTAPADDSPIMVMFPRVNGNAFRLQQIDGPSTIGVFIIGVSLDFQYGIEARTTTFSHSHRIEVMGGNSIGGQFLGQKIRRKGGNTSLNFPWLEEGWVNNDMSDFETHYNEGKPFAMALNPERNEDELAYCWRPDGASELRPTYLPGTRAMDMNMQVEYYVGS